MHHQPLQKSKWTTACTLTAFLLVATLTPAPVHDPPRKTPYELDKLFHFFIHGCFSSALVRVLEDGREIREAAVVAIIVSIAYGVFLEHLQERVPGRRYETGDVLAGALGSVGWIVVNRKARKSFVIKARE